MFDNLPRLVTALTQAKHIIVGVGGGVAMVLMALLMAAFRNFAAAGYCIGIGAVLLLIGAYGIYQVKRAGAQPATPFVSFQTAQGVQYQTPTDASPTAGTPAYGSFPAPPQQTPQMPTSLTELGQQMYAYYESQHGDHTASVPNGQPYGAAPAAAATVAPAVATPAAPVSPELDVIGWVGPVRREHVQHSRVVLGHETDRNSENTLLFTKTQMIALMLGPADVGNGHDAPFLPALLAFTNAMPAMQSMRNPGVSNGYGAEGAEHTFEQLNAGTWDGMLTPLVADLPRALSSHLNWAFPYSRIDRVEIHDRLLNPTVVVHLLDTSTHTYFVYHRTLLAPLRQSLSAYLRVS